MINLFHILRNLTTAKVRDDSTWYSNYLKKRFYVKNGELSALQQKTHKLFLTTFPFYSELKKALDSFGYDYDITLQYKMIACKANDFYPAYNKAIYYYYFEDYVRHLIPNLEVTIHFPTVTIHNQNREKYTIKDLFVKFNIDIHNTIDYLYGQRTTYHPIEREKGYRHSHLSSYNFDEPTHFCLGDSSQLSFSKIMIDEKLKSNDLTDLNELFLFFLYQIKSFVEYESLEGGPYVRISNLKLTDVCIYKHYSNNVYTDTYHELLRAFTTCYNERLVNVLFNLGLLYVNTNQYIIKQRDFERIVFAEKILNANNISSSTKANFFTYTYNNLPVNYNDIIYNINEEYPEEFVIFQGKKIVSKSEIESKFDNLDIKIDVDQSLKNYVYKKFLSENKNNV